MELVVIAEPNTGRLVRLNSAPTEAIVIVVARRVVASTTSSGSGTLRSSSARDL